MPLEVQVSVFRLEYTVFFHSWDISNLYASALSLQYETHVKAWQWHALSKKYFSKKENRAYGDAPAISIGKKSARKSHGMLVSADAARKTMADSS